MILRETHCRDDFGKPLTMVPSVIRGMSGWYEMLISAVYSVLLLYQNKPNNQPLRCVALTLLTGEGWGEYSPILTLSLNKKKHLNDWQTQVLTTNREWLLGEDDQQGKLPRDGKISSHWKSLKTLARPKLCTGLSEEDGRGDSSLLCVFWAQEYLRD